MKHVRQHITGDTYSVCLTPYLYVSKYHLWFDRSSRLYVRITFVTSDTGSSWCQPNNCVGLIHYITSGAVQTQSLCVICHRYQLLDPVKCVQAGGLVS